MAVFRKQQINSTPQKVEKYGGNVHRTGGTEPDTQKAGLQGSEESFRPGAYLSGGVPFFPLRLSFTSALSAHLSLSYFTLPSLLQCR